MPTISKLSIDGVIYDLGSGGIDTSDATALASDILMGKTAYARGIKIEGTIPSILGKDIYPKTEDIIIESGKYLSSSLTIKGEPNLLPENILKGKSIYGVGGELESLEGLTVLMCSATRSPGIAAGYDIYNNGSYKFNFYTEVPSGTIPGTVKKVVIIAISGGANICGHDGGGVFDTDLTNNFLFTSPGSIGHLAFVVLGTV